MNMWESLVWCVAYIARARICGREKKKMSASKKFLPKMEMHFEVKMDEESWKNLKEITEKAEQERRKNLPAMYVTVIALLKFPDVPPVPLTGFIAETVDTKQAYFHAFAGRGYDVSLIAKWDYLAEVLPGYCLASGHRKGDRHD